MQKQINTSLHTLRTAAIFLVILLHVNVSGFQILTENPSDPASGYIMTFFSVLTRIAVPLFLLISGKYILAGLQNTSPREFYRKRVPRLLIPLLAWGFIYFLCCLYAVPGTTIKSYLYDFASGFAHNYTAIHIWYLYMLLGLYLCAPFLYARLSRLSRRSGIWLAAALSVFGAIVEILKGATGINLWFLWWLEFTGLFAFGYVLRDVKLRRIKYRLLLGALLIELLSAGISIYLYERNPMLSSIFHWGVMPHTQITAILLYLFFNAADFDQNLAAKAAPYTLGVYLLHPILIFLLPMPSGIWLFAAVLLKTLLVFLLSLAVIRLLSCISGLKKILQ